MITNNVACMYTYYRERFWIRKGRGGITHTYIGWITTDSI